MPATHRSIPTTAAARATTAYGRSFGVPAAVVALARGADANGLGGVFAPRVPREISPVANPLQHRSAHA